MAKKKKNSQSGNNQFKKQQSVMKPKSVNIAGTEEAAQLMSQVKNPFRINIVYSCCAIFAGIVIALIPVFVHTGSDIDTLSWFGLGAVLMGLFYVWHYLKKGKKFRQYMAQQDHKIVWKYSEEEYKKFLENMNLLITKPSLWQVILVLVGVITVTVLLVLISPADTMWVIIPIGVILFAMSCIFMFAAPRYFLVNAYDAPYISVIDNHQALILGRYHDWKIGNASIRVFPPEFTIKGYALTIGYEGYSMGGKVTYEWSALLPNDNETTIEEAQKQVRAINTYAKERAVYEKKNGDWLDRFFKRISGQTIEPFSLDVREAEKQSRSVEKTVEKK
ncbi:MAG: hypothetical protein ACOYB8_10495 [Eubacteriaceae bacterium]|jgi:hypothetical protein